MTLRTVLFALLLIIVASADGAPVVDVATVGPIGWNSSDRIDVGWTIGNVAGQGAVRVEMNTATDGSADGTWAVLAARTPVAAGTGVLDAIALAGAEGRRALRAVVSDDTGATTAYLGTLFLDRSAPRLRSSAVVDRRPEAVTYQWVLDDGAGSGIDPAGAVLEVEAPGGGVISRQVVVGSDALTQAVVGLPGAVEGTYPVTLVARDRAGLTGRAALAPLSVDRTAPTIGGVHVQRWPTVAHPTVQLGYSVTDATSGVAPDALVTVIDLDSQAVVTRVPGGPGDQSVNVDLPAVSGPVRLALRIADRAGNLGESRTITIDPAAGTLASLYDDARATLLRPAQLAAWVSRRGRRFERVRVVAGRTIAIGGVLRTSAGAPLAVQEIEVRDARDHVLGRTITAGDGTYSLLVRPVVGGKLWVGVPVAGDLLPAGAGVDVQLAPVLRLAVSARTVRARGSALVMTARVTPTPGAVGVGGKNLVFEWRDPFRHTWRPMVNTRLDRAGRARVRWRFNAGGFRVPVRLRLPAEPGWPTEAGMSREVTITVR